MCTYFQAFFRQTLILVFLQISSQPFLVQKAFAQAKNAPASPSAVLPPAAGPSATAIQKHFMELRKNPPELYAFLLRMPKGADLHTHLTGAVYAETLLQTAAADGLCVDLRTLSFVAPGPVIMSGNTSGGTRGVTGGVISGPTGATATNGMAGPQCGVNGVDAKAAQSDNKLAGSLIDSLSMRDFVPGRESAHDHFFGTFGKSAAINREHFGQFIAEVVGRAAEQNESYLELMVLNGNLANALAKGVGFDGNFETSKQKLMTAGLETIVSDMRLRVDELEKGRSSALHCDSQPDSAACHVGVRYIYQVLRELPKEEVFAQVLAGFMLASTDPRVVGINFVQPEDGIVSMRDYHLQMQMVDYAKSLYPKVHVTLHAGELAASLVPPEGLRFHIREAIELGHAERIGHGVDVMYENDAVGLLNLMRQHRVLVEINLTSNDLILGVSGKDHPFPIYKKYGVPLALSTDDEGVSRTHLTEEYLKAVMTYDLSYADLKEMVRNSLEYSFLPGASYWQNQTYRSPTSACAGGAVQTKPCQTFLESNEKAQAQWDLENRFRVFERSLSKTISASGVSRAQ